MKIFIYLILITFLLCKTNSYQYLDEVWINNTQADSTRRVKMASFILYKVGQMAKGSNVLFYTSTADTNWKVQLLLNDLTMTNQVVIDSSNYELNGSFEALIPPSTGHLPYNLENKVNSDEQTTFEISTLILKLTFVKYWKFIIQNPTIGLIRDIPLGIYPIFDYRTRGSSLNIQGFNRFLLINNAQVHLEPSLLNQTNSLHILGSLSNLNVNLETISRYDFIDGCLKVNPFTKVPILTDDWYLSQMIAYNIPVDKAFRNCSIYAHKINEFKIKVPYLFASDLTQVNNIKFLTLENGNLNLIEKRPLKNTKLSSTSISIENDYLIKVTSGFNVNVQSVFNLNSNLTVDCPKSDKLTYWNFNCGDKNTFYWNTSSCYVKLCSLENNEIPSIDITENSDQIDMSMNLQELLPPLLSSREILLKEKNLKVYDKDQRDYFKIKWGNSVFLDLFFANLNKWKLKVISKNIYPQNINLSYDESDQAILEIENQKLEETSISMDSKSLKIGNLNFLKCKTKSLMITNLGTTAFSIDDTPNKSELIFNSPTQSNGIIQDLSSSASFLNSKILIVTDISLISGMIILYGDSIALVNSLNKPFTMNSNCIFYQIETNRTYSTWFESIVKNNGISITENFTKCTMNIFGINRLEVSSLNSIINEVNNTMVKNLIISEGNLYFSYFSKCISVDIQSRNIIIQNTMNLFVNSGDSIMLNINICQSSLFTFDYNITNHFKNYYINCLNQTKYFLQYSSKDLFQLSLCNKILPNIKLLPNLINSSSLITMNIDDQLDFPSQRDLTIFYQKVLLKGLSQINWKQENITLEISLGKGSTSLFVNSNVFNSNPKPLVYINSDSNVDINVPNNATFLFQKSNIQFNPKSFLVETKSSSDHSCLIPKYQCLSQSWIDSQIYSQTCLHQKYKDECLNNILLHINYLDAPFICQYSDITNLKITKNITIDESKKTEISNIDFNILYGLYFTLKGLSSVLYPYFYIFDFGYSAFIVSGLLENVDQNEFSPIRRSIIVFSDSITFGSSNWVCKNSITLYKLSPFFASIGALLIGFIVGWLLFQRRIFNRFFKPHSLINSESNFKTFITEYSYFAFLNITSLVLPIMSSLWGNRMTMILSIIFIFFMIFLIIVSVSGFIMNREELKLSLNLLFQPLILGQILITFITSLLSMIQFETFVVPTLIYIIYQIIRFLILILLTVSFWRYYKSDPDISKVYLISLWIILVISHFFFIASFALGLTFIFIKVGYLEIFLSCVITTFLSSFFQMLIISPVLTIKSSEEYQEIGNVNIKDEIDEQYKFYSY